jgi:hypothetical protein
LVAGRIRRFSSDVPEEAGDFTDRPGPEDSSFLGISAVSLRWEEAEPEAPTLGWEFRRLPFSSGGRSRFRSKRIRHTPA